MGWIKKISSRRLSKTKFRYDRKVKQKMYLISKTIEKLNDSHSEVKVNSWIPESYWATNSTNNANRIFILNAD